MLGAFYCMDGSPLSRSLFLNYLQILWEMILTIATFFSMHAATKSWRSPEPRSCCCSERQSQGIRSERKKGHGRRICWPDLLPEVHIVCFLLFLAPKGILLLAILRGAFVLVRPVRELLNMGASMHKKRGRDGVSRTCEFRTNVWRIVRMAFVSFLWCITWIIFMVLFLFSLFCVSSLRSSVAMV